MYFICFTLLPLTMALISSGVCLIANPILVLTLNRILVRETRLGRSLQQHWPTNMTHSSRKPGRSTAVFEQVKAIDVD